jgi:arylsulfatase A-like enzyme
MIVATFGLAALVHAAPSHPTHPSHPNVIIILADDLGYADVGAYGGKDVPTPNIDSIGANGIRFTNGYVCSPLCSPSRAALLTGRCAPRDGYDGNPPADAKNGGGLDLKEVTLADRLKAAGYYTGIVGKWHLGQLKDHQPLSRGFDSFYGLLTHGIGDDYPKHCVPIYRNWDIVPPPADFTTALGQEGADFIKNHQRQPFFLYLAFTAVHNPFVAPQSYIDKFAHVSKNKLRQRYCAMLSVMDDMIGRVFDQLRASHLENNTLVFFLSDNGAPDGEDIWHNGPLRGGKYSLWEGGIHVPFLVRWPGHIPAGKVSDTRVSEVDILPSVLAAAGVTAPSKLPLDGENILPLLEGAVSTLPDRALYWRYGPQFAINHDGWKTVKPSLDSPPLLFNISSDIGENRELSGQNPQRLKQMIDDWQNWNVQNRPEVNYDPAQNNTFNAQHPHRGDPKGIDASGNPTMIIWGRWRSPASSPSPSPIGHRSAPPD